MAQTTDTGLAAGTQLLPAPELELRVAVRVGVLAGVAGVFFSAVGMVGSFSERMLIDPILSLGYVLLLLAPFGGGYLAARPPAQIEGFAESTPGPRNLLAGVLAGVLSGALLGALIILMSIFDLRSVFIELSDELFDIITFESGAFGGIVLWLAIGAAAGVTGAAVHLIPSRWRRPVLSVVMWALVIGLFQDVPLDIMRNIGLPAAVQRFFFRGTGGMTLWGAAIVGGIAFFAYLGLGRRERTITEVVRGWEPAERRRNAVVGGLVLLVVIAVLPQILGSYLSEVLDLVGIFLMMALGLNIVVGYAGLLDLGYVAFFAVGAYTTAVLTSPDSQTITLLWTFWAAIPFIVLAAAMAGLVVGTPVLRMRGDYLAIVTLGFGEIARILFLSDWLTPVFGGAQGITQIPNITFGLFEVRTPPQFVYPILAFVLLFAYVSWALQHSRVGRAWAAMREDEPVAEVMGVDIVAAKLWAFVIGAVLASFGGSLFAFKIGSIFPHSFNIIVSITVLVIIIVGGIGSIPGVAVGAFVLIGAPELLREFQDFKFLMYGMLLIFMMLQRPEGFIPSRQRARELHHEEALQDAWIRVQEETGLPVEDED